MIAKTSQKFYKQEEFSDAEYWANKSMEECFNATCFLVEQYISWNNLPVKMDKTVFEKVNKHKEWKEEKQLWNNFTEEEKKLFKS